MDPVDRALAFGFLMSLVMYLGGLWHGYLLARRLHEEE